MAAGRSKLDLGEVFIQPTDNQKKVNDRIGVEEMRLADIQTDGAAVGSRGAGLGQSQIYLLKYVFKGKGVYICAVDFYLQQENLP